MKCRRRNCSRTADRQGLCPQHYRYTNRGFVNAAPVREHVQKLQAAGYSLRQLVRLTGLSQPTLMVRTENVQVETASRIYAVKVPADFVAHGRHLIPAVGTHRRVHALSAIGWTQKMVADRSGMHMKQLSQIMRQKEITARTAWRIAAVYESLQLTHGPSDTARKRAKDSRWPGPLAWDKDTIDDPATKPLPVQRKQYDTKSVLTAAELADEVDQHRRLGRTLPQIAERMNIDQEAITRRLQRHEKFVAAVTEHRAEGRADAEIAVLMGIDQRMFHRSLANHGLDPCHDVAV